MHRTGKWAELSWRHPLWDLVRYYRSLRGDKQKEAFITELLESKLISLEEKTFPINNAVIDLFIEYLEEQEQAFNDALESLRTEEEAIAFCKSNKYQVGKTATQNDSHQSSKSMIASVTGVTETVCKEYGVSFNPDPQKRCIWLDEEHLHVTSRNLDGAIPGLTNPEIIWEIKEYWGKTKGGSKMSDAVYECQLVGRELREFEEESEKSITHIVFIDGQVQWSYRKSDLRRLLDLMYQGLIDHIFFGKQVEEDWANILGGLLE